MTQQKLVENDLISWVEERVQESDTLEFKSCRVATKELNQTIRDLCAELSAFANSTGGVLVIGIEEDKVTEGGSYASRLDGLVDKKWTSEWLSSKLEGKITPSILGLSIYDVQLETGGWCLVMNVPKSFQAPHQSVDRKYYARRQFQVLPMAHYEVEDVRNRQRIGRAEVKLELFLDRHVFLQLSTENYGDTPVFDLTFQFEESVEHCFKLVAPAFKFGITALNPGEVRRFEIGFINDLFSHEMLRSDTKITLCFRTENGTKETRTVYFNLGNYDRSSYVLSDVDRLGQLIDERLKELTNQLKSVGNDLRHNLELLYDNTGLVLSFDTLKRLGFEPNVNTKWDPSLLNWRGFMALLDCSSEVGIGLERYFRYIGQGIPRPEELEGMTPELLQLIKDRLKLDYHK